MHEAFILALALTAISELGDKTQFASLALVAHFKQPIMVLAGCFLGFLVVDGFSAYLGEVLYYILDRRILRFISSAIFFVLAFVIASQKAEAKVNVKERGIFTPVLTSMLTIMLLELGDKTQLTTALLSARFGDGLSVIVGVLLALMLIVGLTITIGKKIIEHLPLPMVRRLTVAAYVFGGLILLFEGISGLELALLQ
ncbi:MAG: TMEM165/GDT1 family protein [Nitrososphaerales archaeon]